jgi:cytochrome c
LVSDSAGVLFAILLKGTNVNRYLPLLLTLALVVACKPQEKPPSAGDPNHGKQLVDQYGCATCHIIPGMAGPKGMIGPSLEHVAIRPMIAGKTPNTPQNLTQYIQNPQLTDAQTSMPNLGVKPEEARDIAAYLATLK